MYIIRISYMDTVYVYCICIYNIYIYIQCIYIYKSHDFRWFTINHHFMGRDGTAPKVMSTAPNTMKFWAIPRSAVGLVLFCMNSGGVPKKGDFSMKDIYIVVIYIYYNRRVAKISTDIDKWWLSYQPSNSGEVYGDFSVKYVGDDSWLCLVIVDGL